jgi:hypothetical protein
VINIEADEAVEPPVQELKKHPIFGVTVIETLVPGR